LAYYAEPRATIDIDLNVFVPADHFRCRRRCSTSALPPTIRRPWRQPRDASASCGTTPRSISSSRTTLPRCRRVSSDGAVRHGCVDPDPVAEHLVVCKVIFVGLATGRHRRELPPKSRSMQRKSCGGSDGSQRRRSPLRTDCRRHHPPLICRRDEPGYLRDRPTNHEAAALRSRSHAPWTHWKRWSAMSMRWLDDRAVPDDLVDKLLWAATGHPTRGSQMWDFVVVRTPQRTLPT
jgi:hypothetical protein